MNVVTGAFGYSGKYIARRLLNAGETVITLTGNVNRVSEFGAAVKAVPFRFGDPQAMAVSIAGAHSSTTHIGYASTGETRAMTGLSRIQLR